MSSSLSLSYELISLMGWLLKHEKSALSALIADALRKGFSEEISHATQEEHEQMGEEMHSTVLRFMQFLEAALNERLEAPIDQQTKQDLLEAVQRFDGHEIDLRSVWARVQRAQGEGKAVSPKDTVGEVFSQILHGWEPGREDEIN